MNYDVFNGDADGILALLQLRLAAKSSGDSALSMRSSVESSIKTPNEPTLITGVKRDISLLQKIPIDTLNSNSVVTVLDISMEKNSSALKQVLKTGANVLYIDHHRADAHLESDNELAKGNLQAHIDLSSDTCTALIVDKLIDGAFHHWAICGAYGDNLVSIADSLCKAASLSNLQSDQLKTLGMLINYNGYGAEIGDLAYHPAELFTLLLRYQSPFECIEDLSSPYHLLKSKFEADMSQAKQSEIIFESEHLHASVMPDMPWSRRISGTYGNQLANGTPERAHLVFTIVDSEHYLVSLRAPLNNRVGAGDLCSQFDSGGGRAGAGGINQLPQSEALVLCQRVHDFYAKLDTR
ncbi:DHH family phosphoesterase [Psychrosphaera haliotis]|uniref:DHH family phosphoesterase n=1 Tax=Psychrosphaera haliotis TaxID=555083 RepID=UPI00236916A2|nr:DHH family phosphoesterase [Psychrosphaera haliotis]